MTTIRLGSGAAQAAGIAPKAALLDTAAVHGIAVPEGLIVPGEAPAAEGTGSLDGLTGDLPDARSYAVRSAFGAEDGAHTSLAGWFHSELRVPAPEVPAAIRRVRASAERRAGSFRTDVLVMAMVDAANAGVAFSETGTYDDIVNVTAGTAERLVAGDEAGERRLLPRLESTEPGWPTRLQELLADVRRVFDDRVWDIEWADDGARCWLVQIRPITAPARRDETLTLANHAEILPDLPSAFMTSLVAESGPELFDWYRRHDRSLPADRDFLQVKAGRPMINLSLLEDMMRHLGLPTGLVADSIGGDAVVRRPANLRRLVSKAPVLMRLGFSQITATVGVRARRRRLQKLTDTRTGSLTSAVDALHLAYVALVTGMFPLSSAIGPPLALLRRLGVLHQHASRHRTITTELADAIAALGTAPDAAAVEAFLDRFGHRGVYESDIARPRYRDDTATLYTDSSGDDRSGHGPSGPGPSVDGRSVDGPARHEPPPWTLVGRLSTPLWWVARRPMDAREQWRHDAMAAFAAIRDELVRHAEAAVANGQLPETDALWELEVAEARRLDSGWTPNQAFWADRRRRHEELAELVVPITVNSADDPAVWSAPPVGAGAPSGELIGLSLTSGRVTGIAWVLAEPSNEPPVSDEPVVLVARSIDAGWITTLSHVDAVAVEIGGDLSHGSILVRELDIPAVTNVTGIRQRFTSGDHIEVDAIVGLVRSPSTT
ncbi:MAG: PEP-utilizing enzyme [Actinomycetota bacterium]